VIEDQPAHLAVVLAEDGHDLFRLGRLGEGGEAAQVREDDGHLATVCPEGILGPALDDRGGRCQAGSLPTAPPALDTWSRAD
jgi:hypothetical protein